MINKNKKEQTKRVSISLTTETYYAVENLMAGTGLSRSRAIENVLRENRDIKKGISKIRLEKEYGNISTSSVHKHKEPVSLKTETQKN